MKVGSLVYATNQGLGILARSFYDAGVVTDALIVRHSHYPTHRHWYPGSQVISVRPFDLRAAQRFCRSVDVMLFFETPFEWSLLPYCREHGIKTVLMPMYECMPRTLPYQPDFFLCPSLLDLQHYPERSAFLPVPVSVPWKQRTVARVFVHNAGHGGLKGRNGTREVLEAMQHVRSPIRLIVRSQKRLDAGPHTDDRVAFFKGTLHYGSLWDEGDVFLFPERFNGLSLPLQEARAAGMLVMAGDRFPINTWLPTEPLIPVERYDRNCVSGRCLEFDEAVYDPRTIAATIDAWYGRDISEYSESGRVWAEAMSWERLKPRYLEVLENLL